MIYGFSDRLVALRKRKKLSQATLAYRMGIKPSTVSSYERDMAYPTVENFYKICVILGANSDYLIGLDRKDCLLIDDLSTNQKKIVQDLIIELKNAQIN